VSNRVKIKDLTTQISRPVRVAKVCIKGELWARHDELVEQLDAITGDDPEQPSARKLGGPSNAERNRLLKAIGEVEDEMRANEVALEFRGISQRPLAEIQERHPAKVGNGWDYNAAGAELFAASSVDEVTVEEAQAFLDVLHFGAFQKIVQTILAASGGSSEVPTVARSFARTPTSA
jgi:hypothetical protein